MGEVQTVFKQLDREIDKETEKRNCST